MRRRPNERLALARALALGLALASPLACDRRIEPFDPSEQPREPDLSRIFPPGAQETAVQAGAPLELPPPPMQRGAPALAAEGGAPIRGTLRLAPELAGQVPEGAVLFLIARGATPGPPIAVKRIEAPSFPLDFEIGPADRMIATLPFAGPVLISARLDTDGNATSRTPGDLQGSAAQPVEPGATDVAIVLAERL
jgi:hypothetical protein